MTEKKLTPPEITCAFCHATGEQGGWYRTHPLCTSCTDGLRDVDDFQGRRLVRPVETT